MSEATISRLLTLSEVAELLGRHRTTIYRWYRHNVLPPPVYGPGGRVLGWFVSDLVEWFDRSGRAYEAEE